MAAQINNYASLETPYNYIAEFYYYTLAVPLKAIPVLLKLIDTLTLTQYPNLNTMIILTSILGCLGAIGFLIRYVIMTFGTVAAWVALLWAAPAVLAGVWYIVVAFVGWLMATT